MEEALYLFISLTTQKICERNCTRSFTTDMAESIPTEAQEKARLYPAVAMYGPCNVKGLQPGQKKLWCVCGLSKKQPWCDGSHKGTKFTPVKWTVPDKAQTLYSICACKYTKDPPYCDATHIDIPCDVVHRQKHCTQEHREKKLCEGCGWVPDW